MVLMTLQIIMLLSEFVNGICKMLQDFIPFANIKPLFDKTPQEMVAIDI
jgi:hypothetical protein